LAQPEAVAPAIELRGICKSFGTIQANRDINLRIEKGSIHGIVGENGAGKSTLMSILYGFYKCDAGTIAINGQKTLIPDSQAAIRAGIGMVHQHFKLVQNFTVLENVVLGAEDSFMLQSSLTKARGLLEQLAEEYSLRVDPDVVIEDLSVGHQQRVEILKALYRNAGILILDEPTGVLTPAEADHLFRILLNLKDQGKTIVLITHKLREIMAVTDTVSVMRQGEMVDTLPTRDTNPKQLAKLMVGRSVLLRVQKTAKESGPVKMELRNLSVTDERGVKVLEDISLTVRKGEILGIAGVAGNGQTELLEVLGGITAGNGTLEIGGTRVPLSGSGADARSRRRIGIAHVPEDRQRLGLIMDFYAWENMVFGYQNDERYNRNWLLMNNRQIRRETRRGMEKFDVRPLQTRIQARNFSGGNQQKMVLAREMERDPELLIVGQPTRGVDIGAIEFIHQHLLDLRDRGAGILLVSVELDEILSLTDRVAVLFDGRIIGERVTHETDEADLGLLMAGVAEGQKPAAVSA